MQCKDCLTEIDDKEYYNRSMEGVCKKCRQKISQIKYENKKFGRNREYVPERLKEDNNKIIKKTVKRAIKKTTEKKEIEKEEKPLRIYDEKIEKIVLQDIANTFRNHSVTINPQEIPPFNIFMEMFCSLIDMNNGYMTQYKKAEELFNMMEGDYQHAYEDAQTPELFLERSKMFRCLLDQRRDIKNGIGQYEKIFDILQDIVNKDPDILKKATKAKEDLESIIEAQKGHFYKVKASELISKEDFCVGKRFKTHYCVTIPIMNYYSNKAPFNFTRNVWAEDERTAIADIKNYLKQKFPNCPYNETQFKVEKVSDEVCS